MFEQVCTQSWMKIQIKCEICVSICIYTCVHDLYTVQTCLYMVHHCSSVYVHGTYMSVYGLSLNILLNVCTDCTQFISVHPVSPVSAEKISWGYAVLTLLVLCSTSFRQCYGTGIGCLVQTLFIEVCTP
jgi:hypothetical protein